MIKYLKIVWQDIKIPLMAFGVIVSLILLVGAFIFILSLMPEIVRDFLAVAIVVIGVSGGIYCIFSLLWDWNKSILKRIKKEKF